MRRIRKILVEGVALCGITALGAGLALGQAATSNQQNPAQQNANQQQGASQQNAKQNAPAAPSADQHGQAGNPQEQNPANSGQEGQGQYNGNALGATVAAQGGHGLAVTHIDPNGPAARAGIRDNDRIVSVDGRPFRDQRQLEAYVSAQAGRPVPFVIERDGRNLTIQVFPAPGQGGRGWLGVLLEENSPEGNQPAAAGQTRPNANAKGAEISQIYPNSPAARAGLQPGDRVTQVNGEKVDDAAELVALVHEMKPNTRAEFTIERNNQEQRIPVTIGDRRMEFAGGPSPQGQFGQAGWGQSGPGGPGQFNPQMGQNQWNQGQGQGQFGGQFGGMPPYAAELEHDRQMAMQNQRIEQQLTQLRDEIRQLREQLQQQKK